MGRRLVLFATAAVLVALSLLRLSNDDSAERLANAATASTSREPGVQDAAASASAGKAASAADTSPGNVAPVTTATSQQSDSRSSTSGLLSEVATTGNARPYDFIFCANIVGTLGNALQALKAFLIIVKRMQERGWRVLLQLPAVGLRELDVVPLRSNGTALSELLDLTPLKMLFDLDEVTDAMAERRTTSCWAEGCDVSVWSMAEVQNPWLFDVRVPHLWLGLGRERWMFEDLLENLGALRKGQPLQQRLPQPLRVHWEMQRYSPSRCSPWVYGGALEREVAEALVPLEPAEEERCAFVYVSQILHREGRWKLKSFYPFAFAHPDGLHADIPSVAAKIGELLQEYQIDCANFYVKLLGMTGQDFVDLAHQGAVSRAVNFTAKRLKKANCQLCMQGNMEILRRAAAAPLLVAEPGSFWPDLPAARLTLRHRPVAYIYAETVEKRRWDSRLAKFVDPPPSVALHLMNCPWPGQIYRGSCVVPRNDSHGQAVDPHDGTYDCWPDMG